MRVVTVTLGFMPARVLAASFASYARTRNPQLVYEHVLLDQHYPLEKDTNRQAVRDLCAAHGIKVLDAGRNLGLHLGFNFALAQLDLAPGDIVIAYDGDSFPTTPGWDMALVRAILGDPEQKIAWASLMNPRSRKDIDQRGYTTRKADGFIELHVTKTAVTNSVCAFDYAWLKSVGFLTEPCAFYGHLETAMFNLLGARQWAFLPGWSESDHLRDMHDRSYVVYKWVHAHLKGWDGDFESWLAAGSPVPPENVAPAQLP